MRVEAGFYFLERTDGLLDGLYTFLVEEHARWGRLFGAIASRWRTLRRIDRGHRLQHATPAVG